MLMCSIHSFTSYSNTATSVCFVYVRLILHVYPFWNMDSSSEASLSFVLLFLI